MSDAAFVGQQAVGQLAWIGRGGKVAADHLVSHDAETFVHHPALERRREESVVTTQQESG
jgi:hypothetical protein